MSNFKIIDLTSNTTRVKLSIPRDLRTIEERDCEKKEITLRINSNINPFLSKLDIIKKTKNFFYVYLSFYDYISSQSVQLCMERIAGEKPRIKTISEDELSVILIVRSENVNFNNFKYNGEYLSYFKELKIEPIIFSPENYSDAFKKISREEFSDDLEINHIIIVLNTLAGSYDCFEILKKSKLFSELRFLPELWILFGVLIDSSKISTIREFEFIACAYLRDFDNVSKYPPTKNKTKRKAKIKIDENKLKNKPAICIIDSGIKQFKLLEEQKLFYLNDSILDHGTQVASLAVAGKSLLYKKEEVEQEFNLYSYKICDGKKENIIEGLINAITTYKKSCKLFVLSYNFYEKLEPILLHYLSKRIDYFIHTSNVIVLVSTGNNCDLTIKDGIDFGYLERNPILFPSNCKNIFSTGALFEYDTIYQRIAPYTRYLPYFPDLEHKNEEYFILKPNIYVFGGGESEDKRERYYLSSVCADGYIADYYGTSFANGLLGYYYLKLMEGRPGIKYSETYKALMLAFGNLEILKNRDEGSFMVSINSIKQFESDIKYVLIFNEHFEKLNNYRRDTTSQNCEELSFFINAEKIEKIQVFLVHSNNHIKNPYTASLIYFNIRLIEPNSKKPNADYSTFGDRSRWSTFGKCTPIQLAEYELGQREQKIKSQTGDWKLQMLPIRKNIPTNDEIMLRWSIVIKLIPRKHYLERTEEIYDEIMEKTKGMKPIYKELLKIAVEQKQEA